MRELIVGTFWMLVFIIGTVHLLYWVGSERCTQQSVSFEDHSFNLFSRCMVKHNGKWLPLENIRGFNDK